MRKLDGPALNAAILLVYTEVIALYVKRNT